jgi:hypothetical protein
MVFSLLVSYGPRQLEHVESAGVVDGVDDE